MKRRERPAGPRRESWFTEFVAKRRTVLLVAALLLFAGAARLWLSVRAVPAYSVETVPGPWVRHDVTLSYTVTLRAGTLYPRGAQVGPQQPAVPLKLFGSCQAKLADEFTCGGGELAEARYWVDLLLRAGDLWSKEYPLVAERSAPAGASRFEAVFDLPIPLLLGDIRAIEDEVGLSSPTGRYEAEVRLHTRVRVAGERELLRDYTSGFVFGLATGGLMLEAPETLTARDRYEVPVQTRVAGSVTILGRPWSVDRARQLALAALGLSAGPVAMAFAWWLSGRRGKRPDPARRYRDRLVTVTQVQNSTGNVVVRVGGLAALARIADEAQVPLLELGSVSAGSPAEFDDKPTPELQGRRYFAMVGSTLYYAV